MAEYESVDKGGSSRTRNSKNYDHAPGLPMMDLYGRPLLLEDGSVNPFYGADFGAAPGEMSTGPDVGSADRSAFYNMPGAAGPNVLTGGRVNPSAPGIRTSVDTGSINEKQRAGQRVMPSRNRSVSKARQKTDTNGSPDLINDLMGPVRGMKQVLGWLSKMLGGTQKYPTRDLKGNRYDAEHKRIN